MEQSFFLGVLAFLVLCVYRNFHDDFSECFGYSFKSMVQMANVVDQELLNLYMKHALFDDHLLAIHEHVGTKDPKSTLLAAHPVWDDLQI